MWGGNWPITTCDLAGRLELPICTCPLTHPHPACSVPTREADPLNHITCPVLSDSPVGAADAELEGARRARGDSRGPSCPSAAAAWLRPCAEGSGPGWQFPPPCLPLGTQDEGLPPWLWPPLVGFPEPCLPLSHPVVPPSAFCWDSDRSGCPVSTSPFTKAPHLVGDLWIRNA